MKVLVTGAGALLGQGILRALRHSPLKPWLLAVDPSPLSAGLYWADASALVPMAKDPTYMARIEALLAEHRPDAVLVGTDVELELFAEHRARLESTYGTHIVVASPEVVRIADDKLLTARFMAQHGFPHPASGDRSEAQDVVDRVGYPLIVKPRIGARSIGVHKVHDAKELAAALADVAEPVVQECVGEADAEYTAGAITFDGVCHATIVMRRDLRDGNTYRAFPDHYPALNAQVKAWAEALNAHGPVNFQFRVGADGLPKVFEINGRFSGTTPLRHLAGFPEVDMVLRHIVLGEPVVQPEVKPLTILRHWSETVVAPGDVLA